jgi:hypothetical protein
MAAHPQGAHPISWPGLADEDPVANRVTVEERKPRIVRTCLCETALPLLKRGEYHAIRPFPNRQRFSREKEDTVRFRAQKLSAFHNHQRVALTPNAAIAGNIHAPLVTTGA